jgi:hypothetical protein
MDPNSFIKLFREDTQNDLVAVICVTYDALGKDIIIHAWVKTLKENDTLLQIWLTDMDTKLGIPEYIPWVSSVVEFEVEQHVTKAHVGLIDSKWPAHGENLEYIARVLGYFRHDGKVAKFLFEKPFTYPGSE